MKAFCLDATKSKRIGLVALLLASLVLRLRLFGYVSDDMMTCLLPWSEFIRAHGGLPALGHQIGNYPPFFYYLLTIASYLPLPRVHAIKALSVVFDYVMAGYVLGIVRQRYPTGLKPVAAGLATLFLPTVVLNSSVWGQCDAMYTAGLMACVYYLLRRQHVWALLAYGLACSLKPQALFLVPLLMVCVLQRRFPLLLLYLVPGAYVAAALPTCLLGRPLTEVLLIYMDQGVLASSSLSLGATNVYQWFSDNHFGLFFHAGLVIAALVAVGFTLFVSRRQPGHLSDEALLSAALVSLVLMPYILPAMHERYFFPADVLGVAFAFWFPARWLIAALIQAASFFTYLPYLFNQEPVPRPYLALVMGAALVLVLQHLIEVTGGPAALPVTERAASAGGSEAAPQSLALR